MWYRNSRESKTRFRHSRESGFCRPVKQYYVIPAKAKQDIVIPAKAGIHFILLSDYSAGLSIPG
jgi:hypothetical protein